MNSLPGDKRNQLILVALVTAVVIAGLWYGLIGIEQSALGARADMIGQMQEKVDTARRRAAHLDEFKDELARATATLQNIENQMASGDVYVWIIKTLQNFQAPYQVQITNFDPPTIGETPLLPKVPYRTATFSVLGTARYHDLEIFLANLEDAFPCVRVQKLELEPMSFARSAGGDDEEKLTFKLELATLIKPPSVRP
jgi:Tfp pilus assembly protein PilO